ncbi:MAG: heparinase II/III family protein [Verrucomicrobia bacterium]|nr:heparinase II/III family protein [Verrucomicrobiota bacterium]
MPPRPLLGLVLALSAGLVASQGATAPDALAHLRSGHPRLLATAADWAEVRARIAADPAAAALHLGVMRAAQAILDEPVARRELLGRRLLGVSRRVLGRILDLGYAWRMTGDAAFARRAEAEMRAAADFSDWNPSHFLDVGEMTAALAIGYDWTEDALAPESRAAIKRAIIAKGLRPGLDPKAEHNWWHVAENNWNQVCWGGLTLGALTIAEDDPALARQVLALARANLAHGLAPYAPDGIYPEGPGYWSYGTSFQVMLDAALTTALGDDWGLAAAPGFLASAGVFVQTIGPTGRCYNFSDGGELPGFQPALCWFARQTGDAGLLAPNDRVLHDPAAGIGAAVADRLAVLALLWWPDKPAAATPRLPLRWSGDGPNPLAVFRESWTDPRSLYLALKGGAAVVNHGHMDAGSFVLEADGVRWAVDLGAQDYYSLESKHVDLWNKAQDSQRWDVYRIGPFTHNTLTIDGQRHRVEGRARLIDFSADAADPRAVLDLTPVFAGAAAYVHRGFRVLPDRRVLVQDELRGLTPGARVRWAMATRAEVSCTGGTATLRQEGQTLQVQLLDSPAADFTAAPADPPADGFNAPNPGVSLLTATFTATADGSLRVAVVLAPGARAGAAPRLVPLASW